MKPNVKVCAAVTLTVTCLFISKPPLGRAAELNDIEKLGVPLSHLSEAKTAQREGKRVFVWRGSNEEVKGFNTPIGQMVSVDVQYAQLVQGDIPFNLYFRTQSARKEAGLGPNDPPYTVYGAETPGPKTNTQTGKLRVYFVSPKDKLSGEGTGYVFAVDPATKEKKKEEKPRPVSDAVSNELKINIHFEDAKQPPN